ncbi:hypothetical protein OKW37_008217 [Paraburkholderia sp. MM5482-R2]
MANPGDSRIAILLRVFGKQLVRGERAIRAARDDIGERAAAVDPELPAGRRANIGGVIVLHGVVVVMRKW